MEEIYAKYEEWFETNRPISALVFFLLWEHRAFSNLPALKAREQEFTPGWAVGWWFVPFANLVKPYQGMTEL